MARKLSPGIHMVRTKRGTRKVRVLSSGQWRFMKMGKKKSTPKKKSKKSSSRKGGYKMANKKKGRGGGKSLTQQVFKWIRIGALVGPGIGQALRWKDAGAETMVDQVLRVYTGYDFQSGQWQWHWLAEGWTPYLASVLATKGIQKLSGIIRRL